MTNGKSRNTNAWFRAQPNRNRPSVPVEGIAQTVRAVLGAVRGNTAQPKPRRGGNRMPTGRGQRQRISAQQIQRMPRSLLYTGETFNNTPTKDLQRKAWQLTPATSNMMAPKGSEYYDAFRPHPITTTMAIGAVTPIPAKTTFTISSSNVGPSLVIIGPSCGHVQAMSWQFKLKTGLTSAQLSEAASGALSGTYYDVSVNRYASPHLLEDHPMEAIPARCSVQVQNVSRKFDVGGSVYCMRLTAGHRINDTSSVGDVLRFCSGIINDKLATKHMASELNTSALQKNSIVADQSRALMFKDWASVSLNDMHVDFPVGDTTHGGYGPSDQSVNDTLPGGWGQWGPHTVTGLDSNLERDFKSLHLGTVHRSPFDAYLDNPTFTPIAFVIMPLGANMHALSVFDTAASTVVTTGGISVVSPAVADADGTPGVDDATTPIIVGSSAPSNQYNFTVATQFLARYRPGRQLAQFAAVPQVDRVANDRGAQYEHTIGNRMVKGLMDNLPTAMELLPQMARMAMV